MMHLNVRAVQIRYGARPKYALVQGEGKKAIIKINDVGALTPGRIIDFNERTMRYFDPSLQRGVIDGVKVTPLFGDDWTASSCIEAIEGESRVVE
jgi:rare lipoprotein A